jgi:hypothetical protein
MTEPSGDGGRFQEGFCRDAAPEYARSAESFALDNGGGQTELGTPNGAHIPGRAAAKKDYVEGSHVVDGWWLLVAGLETESGNGVSLVMESDPICAKWSLTPIR